VYGKGRKRAVTKSPGREFCISDDNADEYVDALETVMEFVNALVKQRKLCKNCLLSNFATTALAVTIADFYKKDPVAGVLALVEHQTETQKKIHALIGKKAPTKN